MSGATEMGRPARRHAGGRPGTVGNSIHETTPSRLLALGDLTAILVGFVAALGTLGGASLAGTALAVIGAVMLGLAAIRMQRLWDSTVTAVRWVELAKVTRVAAVLGAGVLVADRIPGSPVHLWPGLAAAAAVWLLLVAWRSAYRSWLTLQRRNGRFTQQVLVVGTDRRTLELVRTLEVHPEAGMRVVGLVGSRRAARAAGYGELWLGDMADAADVLTSTPSECVMVGSTDDVSPALLDTLVRGTSGRQVFLVPSVGAVDPARITSSAVANETLMCVEPAETSTIGLSLKRAFDVLVAAAMLVITSPVLLVAAILIKRTDGGPVFFRQQRVGKDDQEFGMLKFRTMVVDAEARLAEMQRDNQRSGPLFKLANDPRVTRIGNFLRRTSLDELPQLINVLKGDMSLVGPRPALRREVEAFPADLRDRHRVRPGITGLWQVEARDNPAFDAYQRLDLFYVKNWSLMLDIGILLGTAEQLLMRPFVSRRQGEMATVTAMPSIAAAA